MNRNPMRCVNFQIIYLSGGFNGCNKLSIGSRELFSFKLRFIHIEFILISDTEKSWKVCKEKYISAMNAENYLSRRKDYPAIK